jgi:hypothetical protein
MTAALGTLPFLATLWLLAVLGAAVLEESGAKIAAALKGERMQPKSARPRSIRLRSRPAVRDAIAANVQWRAAA